MRLLGVYACLHVVITAVKAYVVISSGAPTAPTTVIVSFIKSTCAPGKMRGRCRGPASVGSRMRRLSRLPCLWRRSWRGAPQTRPEGPCSSPILLQAQPETLNPHLVGLQACIDPQQDSQPPPPKKINLMVSTPQTPARPPPNRAARRGHLVKGGALVQALRQRPRRLQAKPPGGTQPLN